MKIPARNIENPSGIILTRDNSSVVNQHPKKEAELPQQYQSSSKESPTTMGDYGSSTKNSNNQQASSLDLRRTIVDSSSCDRTMTTTSTACPNQPSCSNSNSTNSNNTMLSKKLHSRNNSIIHSNNQNNNKNRTVESHPRNDMRLHHYPIDDNSGHHAIHMVHDEESPLTDVEERRHVHEQPHGNPPSAFLPRDTLSSLDDCSSSESRMVLWLRALLLFFLCTCMICVAVFIYTYTTNAEQDEFEDRFCDSAEKVLEAIGSTLAFSLGALDSFAVDTALLAQNHHDHYDQIMNHQNQPNNQSTASTNIDDSDEEDEDPWPFVTTPNFARRAAKLRSLSKAFTIVQYNLVPPHLRDEWELYALEQDGWVQEALDYQKNDENFQGIQMDNYTAQPTLYNHFSMDTPRRHDTPYLPSWQAYPVVPIYPAYNWDVLDFIPFENVYDHVFTEQSVMMRITNLPEDPTDEQAVLEAGYVADWAASYLPPDSNPSEPQVEVYYPLLSSVNNEIPRAVGAHSLSILWRDLLTDILPNGTGGVNAVFTLGPSVFTYHIDASKVTFLGQGHHHETNHLKHEKALHDLMSSSTYTGLPLSVELKNYKIEIYPSARMKDVYTTKAPAYITALSVMIFAFTSLVFLLYDRCVVRRQRKVNGKANQSRESVCLLEHMVKERTKCLETSNMQLEEANRRVVQASELQLQHFACMSHEIRTPLNCIVGLSSLMEESESLNQLQRDSMRMIVSSGELLRAVVDDVLDYSKLETGHVKIEMKRSNLQQLLSSVVHSIEIRGLATDVCIKTFYDCAVPEFVQTDTRRLQQILFNLLGNAVKFSQKGGTVDLRVSIDCPGFSDHAYSPPVANKEGPSTGTSLSRSDKALRFTVTDYGIGIDKQDYPNIFKPFIQTGEQVDNENIFGGTGLGLPITAKLIHAFGGSIAVESRKREWTRFTVDFPFTDEVVDVSLIATDLKDCAVLLVSNEADECVHVCDILQCYNLKCSVFAGMEELKAQLESSQFLSAEKSSVLLVEEELYDVATYRLLSSRLPTALITFGPKFQTAEACAHHRSLTKMLPSALVSSMLACTKNLGKTKDISMPNQLPHSQARYCALRYLIAEDNLVNQKVLRVILKRLGVNDVEIVGNGQEAVEREAESPFDVVLMDMQMPILGGVDACRLINERAGGHARAKVIFVTAHVQENFRDECLEAGAIGYLPKPCTLQSVQECLVKHFT